MSRIVGEITLFGGDFAPRGWLRCGGTVVNIADYRSLYEVIGTAYGGDGVTTFGLPDLEGPYIICASGCVPGATSPTWGGLPLPASGTPVYGGISTQAVSGGQITVPHGMPATPTAASAIVKDDHGRYLCVREIDSANIILYPYENDGSITTDGISITLYWIAI